MARIYSAAARLKRLSYFTYLTQNFHSDLQWWHLFATHLNGLNILSCSRPDHKIFTDASGCWSCGAILIFGAQWMHLAWSVEWLQQDIMTKELVPIVLSCVAWGPVLSSTSVEFRCDNSSVVDSINKGSSRSQQSCICYNASGFSVLTLMSK